MTENLLNFIITLTGDDRPGILDDVTGVIQRNSGHVAELRSIDAGGVFAMLITVRMSAEAMEALAHQLREIADSRGLTAIVKPATTCRCEKKGQQFRLVACGDDHVGVLKKLSHLLRVLSINIEEIATQSETDGRVTMTLTLGVPRECPVSKLREFLAQLLGPIEMRWELTGV